MYPPFRNLPQNPVGPGKSVFIPSSISFTYGSWPTQTAIPPSALVTSDNFNWTPQNYSSSTLTAWHDPSWSPYYQTSGGFVTSDTDLSTGGFNEVTGPSGTGPAISANAIGGLDADSFNGTNQYLVSNRDSGSSLQSIIAVIKPNSVAGGPRTIYGDQSAGGLQFRVESNGALGMNKQNIAVIKSTTSTGLIVDNTVYIVVGSYNDSTGAYRFHINGTVTETGTVTPAGLTSSAQSIIGYNINNNSEYWSGLIGERIIINSNTLSDIQLAEGYLAWKWGQVSALDSGHPYKSAPPQQVTFGTGSGSAAGAGVASGIGASTAAATGSAAGAGVASGIGASTAAATGSAAGVGAATAVGLAVTPAVGSAAGAGAATAVGASTAADAVTAAGAGAASGVGASTAASAASAAGVGAASGVGASTAAAVGSAAGTGAATAVGKSTAADAVTAAGAGAASGVGASTAASVGSAAGAGAATAVGASTARDAVTAAGAGAASGIGASTAAAVGSATGTGAATGVGKSTAASIGSAAGTGAASGVGASTAAAVGSAAGAGAATAVGAAGTIGTAAGAGVASGIGASTAAATGSAAGSSTATAIGASLVPAIGTVAGAGAATGVGKSTAAAVGSATGAGAAIGLVPGTVTSAVGHASGTGSAHAVGVAIVPHVSVSGNAMRSTRRVIVPAKNSGMYVPSRLRKAG